MAIKLGAHLSIAGGYHNALLKIKDICGNCLQIFSCSPRAWDFSMPPPERITAFITLRQKLDISPIYFHASYLINLANSPDNAGNSRRALIKDLTLAAHLGVKGVIVHTGSFKA